jgi:hypothetical protein
VRFACVACGKTRDSEPERWRHVEAVDTGRLCLERELVAVSRKSAPHRDDWRWE